MFFRHSPFSLFFSCIFLVFSQVSVGSPSNDNIIKSPADDRQYRSLSLDNGLRVMLVSDAKADVAAAALDVHVGSGNDPIDRQGMAHYLEHMLFLGTKKYPKASEYQQYISQHGGSNNAYTVLNHTNYFFNIAPDYFEGALDRFAQFFIAPLFNEDNVKQERANVHSEYKARKDDEGRRLWKARRELYNPAHESTKFSVGNLTTLADKESALDGVSEAVSVRDDLIAFYQQYYHSSRMALSVVSHHSLDQLESWVRDKFAMVKKSGAAYQPFTEPLILAKDLPKQLSLKPLKNRRSLTFSFPIESMYAKVDSKPSSYLSNLLGHEGKGSLLAELKNRAWANGLSAGLGYSDDVQATFDINISLSEQGSNHIGEIGELLFSTIALVRQQGIQQAYFDEMKKLAELDFNYQEQSSESALVQSLASMLHRYDASEVLSKPYLFEKFNVLAIRQVLVRLRPDNLQLIITDPALKASQSTDWYDVAFEIKDIQPDWLSKWHLAADLAPDQTADQTIHLPAKNPFVPNNIKLVAASAEIQRKPAKLKNTGKVAVWHQTNLAFKQPKAERYFSLRSSDANASPRDAALTELYVLAAREALNSYAYPAHLAGLSFRIYQHSRGLSVRISGYSDKQSHLLDEIVRVLKTLEVSEQQFSHYVENTKRKLENALKAGASEVVINGVYDVLLSSSWSNKEKLSALEGITLSDLKQHKQKLLSTPDLLVLSMGNTSEADSRKIGESVARLLPETGKSRRVPRAKVRALTQGSWTTLHAPAEHDDAALVLLFQGEKTEVQERALMQMLGALIHPPYYQSLRTEASVGYIVSAFSFNLQDAPALGFSVQSNSHSVADIIEMSEVFLQDYAEQLAQLSDETFASSKAGLVTRLSKEDKQLSDIASRYWTELDREATLFDTKAQLIAAVQSLNKQQLLEYFNARILGNKSAALLSYSFGKQSAELALEGGHAVEAINSLDRFRADTKTYF